MIINKIYQNLHTRVSKTYCTNFIISPTGPNCTSIFMDNEIKFQHPDTNQQTGKNCNSPALSLMQSEPCDLNPFHHYTNIRPDFPASTFYDLFQHVQTFLSRMNHQCYLGALQRTHDNVEGQTHPFPQTVYLGSLLSSSGS